MAFHTIDLSDKDFESIQQFIGFEDENLSELKRFFKCDFILRDQMLKYESEQVYQIQQVIQACFQLIDRRRVLSRQDIAYLCRLAIEGKLEHFKPSHLQMVAKTKSGKVIYPKTLGQAILCEAFRHNDIVFATGVAGTGKTYLAVCHAVNALKEHKIEKIILTRPAVEAGESLGFLPGDMKEKVDPYLRPLYDALYDMLGVEMVEKLIEKQVIEIAPLAFMRGRTLNKAIVILDEAQNTTKSQMKMFLTRMGNEAQMIINGDITQIDLIRKEDSGLVQATKILKDIDRIEIVHMQNADVVRHPLVQKIIERYAEIEK